MSNINWPEVVAGVVIGFLLSAARQVYLYFRYTRSPGRRRYLGEWHGYWRSTTGLGLIGHEKLDIRYSLLRNKLIVKVAAPTILDNGQREVEYEGTISGRRGMVRYLYLKDRASHIEESWAMIDPFYDPIDVTEGVQVTLDLRGLPVATGQLLSRRELEDDELELRLPKPIVTTDPLQVVLDTHSRLTSLQGVVDRRRIEKPSTETRRGK